MNRGGEGIPVQIEGVYSAGVVGTLDYSVPNARERWTGEPQLALTPLVPLRGVAVVCLVEGDEPIHIVRVDKGHL